MYQIVTLGELRLKKNDMKRNWRMKIRTSANQRAIQLMPVQLLSWRSNLAPVTIVTMWRRYRESLYLGSLPTSGLTIILYLLQSVTILLSIYHPLLSHIVNYNKGQYFMLLSTWRYYKFIIRSFKCILRGHGCQSLKSFFLHFIVLINSHRIQSQ